MLLWATLANFPQRYVAARLEPVKQVVDLSKFPDPITMCIEIVKNFKPSQLRLSSRIGGNDMEKKAVPSEAQYQDEFTEMRVVCSLEVS